MDFADFIILFVGVVSLTWVTNWHMDKVRDQILTALKDREK